MADTPNCHQRVSGIKKTAEHAIFYYVSELTACIEPDHLVLNDVLGETGVVSHAAVVASMVVRVTRQGGGFLQMNTFLTRIWYDSLSKSLGWRPELIERDWFWTIPAKDGYMQ